MLIRRLAVTAMIVKLQESIPTSQKVVRSIWVIQILGTTLATPPATPIGILQKWIQGAWCTGGGV